MESLQGHLLVAAPHQLDPNFVKTVILVVQHTNRGAFGLVINRCGADYNGLLWERVAKHFGLDRHRLHLGGPVAGPPMAVHGNERCGEIEILPGLFFSAKKRNVRAVVEQDAAPCKVFVGYAGWGPGQLDYEVERGVWRPLPATVENVFSFFSDEDLWEELGRQAGRSLMRAVLGIKHVPSDPLWN